MKHTISHIFAMLTLMMFFIGCGEAEKDFFDDKDAFFAFETSAGAIDEHSSEPLSIPIYLSKTEAAGVVAYEIDIEGIENPAVEGVDYRIETNSYTVDFNGEWIENIDIIPIDNDVRDGLKQFRINLIEKGSSEAIGMANNANTVFLVSINDNEHPMASMFGTLNVNETTIVPEEFNYQVTLSGHADPDKAILTGLWDVPQPLVLQFNYETNEVIIMPDQEMYAVNVGIPLDFIIKGWQWAPDGSGKLQLFPEAVGTFSLEAGEIEFPNGYLLQCSGPEGSQYIGGIWAWSVQDYSKMTKQ